MKTGKVLGGVTAILSTVIVADVQACDEGSHDRGYARPVAYRRGFARPVAYRPYAWRRAEYRPVAVARRATYRNSYYGGSWPYYGYFAGGGWPYSYGYGGWGYPSDSETSYRVSPAYTYAVAGTPRYTYAVTRQPYNTYAVTGSPAYTCAVAGDPAVMRLQRRLARAGFDPGPIDGIMGPMTQAALEQFNQSCGSMP